MPPDMALRQGFFLGWRYALKLFVICGLINCTMRHVWLFPFTFARPAALRRSPRPPRCAPSSQTAQAE